MINISQSIQAKVDTFPVGIIFDYQAFPGFVETPDAVIKAVGRFVANKKLKRLSKGKFYVPQKSMLGFSKPNDTELIRSELYKNGRLCGYVTGLFLYNQLGLTTQIPQTITIAYNGGRQEKNFGTIRIRKSVTRIPIQEKNVKFLQYLDALKDIKKILDSDINQSLQIIKGYIAQLSERQQKRLINIAIKYYSPQVRALLGLLFSSLGVRELSKIADSLNPVTIYKLNLDKSVWPNAGDWNIR